MRITGVAAGFVAVAALAGCGGGSKPATVDTSAMMREMGYTSPSHAAVAKYVATIRKNECKNDQKTDEFEIASALDDGDTTMVKNVRIAMKYLCPDKVKTWNKAAAEVASLG